MFELLLDEHGHGRDDEELPVPEAAPAAAVVAARRPQRGGVEHHSQQTKDKLKLVAAQRRIKSQDNVIRTLAEGNFATFSDHTAAVTFGHKNPFDHNIVVVAGGGVLTSMNAHRGNRSHDMLVSKHYGCVGAVHGQAQGLANFVQETTAAGHLMHSISVSTFDDSAMWVKDPASKNDRDAGLRTEGARLADGTLRRRGKNISLPVFNMTECIYTLRKYIPDTQSSSDVAIPIWRAALLHSPSQVLPKANTYTIANRRDRWIGMGVNGAGSYFDPDSVVSPSLSSWHTVVTTKDNLELNNLIVGRDESVIRDRLESGLADLGNTITLLSLNCAGHSCVLSTKLVSERLDNMPKMFVKLGHLHESGRIASEFQSAIDSVIEHKFIYDAVAEMPEESIAWRSKAAFILRSTRACMDLTPEQEELIMSVDNSNWDNAEWRHLCTGPGCVCGGSEAEALRLMKMCAKLSVGHMESTPLAFRWKGMEKFGAKMYRGRRQHDLYYHAHLLVFPKEKTKRSIEAIEGLSAGQLANLSNDQIRHKTNVRGGTIVAQMEESDPNALLLEKLMVMNTGVQTYLNKCFESDKHVTALTLLLQSVPNNSTTPQGASVAKAREKAIEANLYIISGQAGLNLLSDYTRYFYFDSPDWAGWRLNHDEKFDTCNDAIMIMQDAYYRLIFRMDDPKFRVFEVCRVSADDEDHVMTARSNVAAIRQQKIRCSKCVDDTFTGPWLDRLFDRGRATAARAIDSLKETCAVLRCTSTLVEKKHLVGQESKPAKRGVAIKADEVGGFVFKRLIRRSADQCRDAASLATLGDAKTKEAFQRALVDHLQQGRIDRRTEDACHGSGANPTKKKVKRLVKFGNQMTGARLRGYDVFVRTNYHDGLEGNTPFEKRKTLDLAWHRLSPAEKQSYKEAADSETNEDMQFNGETFKQFKERMHDSVEASKKRKTKRFLTNKLQAVQKTISDLMNHDVFQSGTELHHFDKGIKPSLIKVKATWKEAAEEYNRSFGYDHLAVPNPRHMTSAFKPCCQLHGGLCGDHDDFAREADVLTFNMFAKSKELKWKAEFPVMLEVGAGNFVLFGRVVGNGLICIVSKCILIPRTPDNPWDCCDIDNGHLNGRHVPMTSQRFFASVVGHLAAEAVEPIQELPLRRWNYVRDDTVSHFRARLIDVQPESECMLQCTVKQTARKRKAPDPDDALPFGLGQRKLRDPKPKPMEAFEFTCHDDHAGSDGDDDQSQGRRSDDAHVDDDCKSEEASEECVSDIEHDPPGPDAGNDSEAEHSSDLDLVPEAWNCVGIKTFEVTAPRARAACCNCSQKIAPGSVRIDYRFKESNSLGDQKRCCLKPACIQALPAATRARDIKVVQRWLADPALSALEYASLSELLSALRV